MQASANRIVWFLKDTSLSWEKKFNYLINRKPGLPSVRTVKVLCNNEPKSTSHQMPRFSISPHLLSRDATPCFLSLSLISKWVFIGIGFLFFFFRSFCIPWDWLPIWNSPVSDNLKKRTINKYAKFKREKSNQQTEMTLLSSGPLISSCCSISSLHWFLHLSCFISLKSAYVLNGPDWEINVDFNQPRIDARRPLLIREPAVWD